MTCFGCDEAAFIEGANVQLLSGEKVAVLAPLDSSRGLIVNLIGGMLRPDRGKVYVFGQDMAWLDADALNGIRRKIGFVFPEGMLISNLKVIENVSLPLLYHSDLTYDECMQRSLRLLGTAGYRGEVWAQPGAIDPYALRAVATARAMAMEPEILVCENLTGGLGAEQKAKISEVASQYHRTCKGSLLLQIIYNESDIALMNPDRVLRIDGNRLVE
jgi:phospholipid/cholesterol/gamma-HCH transport system ATP-binding protein